MPYIGEERDRSPLDVMRDRQCHCLDGGFLAALALWRIGFPPKLIDLAPEAHADDDHVLAVFHVDGRWGAVAKSNYINLGYREPVYKNVRELAMTYFEHFVNIHREKTLRGFTNPFDISNFPLMDWPWNEASAAKLYAKFYSRKVFPLVARKLVKQLNPASARV